MSQMCMSVAPARIAACVPPPPKGEIYRTPFCHLPNGHDGPCWGMGFRWLPQQPPQPLDRVQEPADEGGRVEQRDHAQRGED